MVKTERKAMGKSNKIKNTDRNGILLALEKDLEFIKSVATNHKNWNEETARAVTKLIGWGSVERVLKIGKKARSLVPWGVTANLICLSMRLFVATVS